MISHLEPEILWRQFENICAIPHPSGHEAELRRYLKLFAEQHGLAYYSDTVGNVFIEKAASPGLENSPKVILQGHMDMVPQKNSATVFDFESDPVQPVIDGDWVKAQGTTLGADNGIGMAAALAVLEDSRTMHGPLAALFTVEEETGLTGASGVHPRFLDADILLNLDSEEDGFAYIGCAGGCRTDFILNFDHVAAPVEYVAVSVAVSGLRGGHSGMDIDLGRANANKLLARLLCEAGERFDLRLASINGGGLDNAIPREAVAELLLPADQEMEFGYFVELFHKNAREEYAVADPDINICLHKSAPQSHVLEKEIQDSLIKLINECPNGVVARADGMVQTSTNFASISTTGDMLKITTSQRSSIDAERDALTDGIAALFEAAGADTIRRNSYPGWAPDENSKVLSLLSKAYSELFDAGLNVRTIHAGLECGCFKGINPDIDMASFGPEIVNPHSPDEKVQISSVSRFWRLLNRLLEKISATQV